MSPQKASLHAWTAYHQRNRHAMLLDVGPRDADFLSVVSHIRHRLLELALFDQE
jgi:hypothetical protein